MVFDSTKAYLHTVTGGYDNIKRRQVRQLFQEESEEAAEEESDEDNMDIIVGVLEEFHAIGVKTFKLSHVVQTLDIFALDELFNSDNSIANFLNSPRLRLPRDGEQWVVPDEERIMTLKRSFCVRDAEAITDLLSRTYPHEN